MVNFVWRGRTTHADLSPEAPGAQRPHAIEAERGARRPRWRPPEAARHLRPHGDLRRRQVAGRRSDASPAPLTITSSLSLLPAPQARVGSQRHSCPSHGLAPQARRVLRAEARLRSRAPPPSAHLAIATSPLVLPAPQALLGSRRRPCPLHTVWRRRLDKHTPRRVSSQIKSGVTRTPW